MRRIYNRDGELRTVETYGKLVCDEQGKVIKLLGLAQDITKRKKAEEEILQLKDKIAQSATDKYHAILDSIDDGFVLCELVRDTAGKAFDFRYLEFNTAFEKQRKVKMQDYAGRTGREVYPNFDSWWVTTFEKVIDSRQPIRFERFFENRWWEVGVFPFKEDRFSVLFRDITNRRRDEAKLHRAAQLDAFRVKLLDALRPLKDASKIQAETVRVLREQLHATEVFYAHMEVKDGVAYIVPDSVANAGDLATKESNTALSLCSKKLHQEALKGKTLVVNDVAIDPRHTDEERKTYLAQNIHSYISVPLIDKEVLQGFLCVQHKEPRQWTSEEVLLTEETAERTWAFSERAKFEEALHSNEAQLSAIVDALPVGLCFIDINGKMTISNKEMKRFIPNNIIPSEDMELYGRWIAQSPDGTRLERRDYPGARALRGETVFPGVVFFTCTGKVRSISGKPHSTVRPSSMRPLLFEIK